MTATTHFVRSALPAYNLSGTSIHMVVSEGHRRVKRISSPTRVYNSGMDKTNIYVLKCEYGKYYVGKTADVQRRFKEHVDGKGSAWTKKYRPLEIVKIVKDASSFDEDKITKELMSMHGIDNVRGGAYVSEVLDDSQRDAIQRELWGARNQCTTCGRHGHYAKDCYARTTVDGCMIESESEGEDSDEDSGYYVYTRKPVCYKCGTPGHYATTCWKR